MFRKFRNKKNKISKEVNIDFLHREIERKSKIEAMMLEIAILFRSPDNLDIAINKALKLLIEASGAERAYIMQLKDENTQFLSHEKCRWNAIPIKRFLQNIPYTRQQWMIDQYYKQGYVAIEDIDEMPKEAESMQQIFKKGKIGSIVSSSFASKHTYKGNICLTNRNKIEKWDADIIQLVQLIATLIENSIERIDAEYNLFKAKQKAEESDSLKTAFLMNISHELRTPINGIVGFSHILSKTNLSDEKRKEITSILASNSMQLLSIMEDLIEISKIESNSISLEIKQIELEHFILSLYNKNKFAVHCKKLQFNINIPEYCKKILIDADLEKLTQIFQHLLNNAIKFTKHGAVELGCDVENGKVVIYVKDTGIGIDEKHNEDVFKRFWQIDMTSTRTYGGNGLGLSICKELCELLGYKISLDSEVNKGSVFSIFIPIDSSDSNKNIKKGFVKKHLKNILILEDVELLYKHISDVLDDFGYKTTFVKNIDIAKKMLKDNIFNFAIIDVNIDNGAGFEIAEYIKTNNIQCHLIAQSIIPSKEEREKSVMKGFENYIEKPFTEKDLKNVL